MREQTPRARRAASRATSTAAVCARRLGSAENVTRCARADAGRPRRCRGDCATAGTTHISVVDAHGNAASLSASTGSGSGVIVPGTGIHLNNMLGEYDLQSGRRRRQRRGAADEHDGAVDRPAPRAARGSSSAARARSRLRGAIMQAVVNVVDHGLRRRARRSTAPRVHLDEPHLHCEGGARPGCARPAGDARLRRRPLAPAQPLLRRRRRGRGRRGGTARRGGRPARAAAHGSWSGDRRAGATCPAGRRAPRSSRSPRRSGRSPRAG